MCRPNELVPTLNKEVVLGIHWQRGLMEVNKQQLRSIQPEVHKKGKKINNIGILLIQMKELNIITIIETVDGPEVGRSEIPIRTQ